MELVSTTIPDRDERSMKPLKTAGETRGPKSRRHRVPLLTITVDDDERFFHWLVGDHKLSESSGSALNASSKDSEWLLQSKGFETWLYGTGK